MQSACHPLSWFTERIGKKIQRAPYNRKYKGLHRSWTDHIKIHNKVFAEYLFNLQEEEGYRYQDVPLEIKQTTLP